jgi:hypothetical protein
VLQFWILPFGSAVGDEPTKTSFCLLNHILS